MYLRRADDDLQLRIDGKLVAEAKTARRYKGGAPLLLQGGDQLAVREVEVLYPSDAPHGGGFSTGCPQPVPTLRPLLHTTYGG